MLAVFDARFKGLWKRVSNRSFSNYRTDPGDVISWKATLPSLPFLLLVADYSKRPSLSINRNNSMLVFKLVDDFCSSFCKLPTIRHLSWLDMCRGVARYHFSGCVCL